MANHRDSDPHTTPAPNQLAEHKRYPGRASGTILVVGAILLDVWADYRRSNPGEVHHTGEMKFAVGGAGYNIAVNLAQMYIQTSLFSVVKEGSFAAVWMRARLKEANVNLEFLQTSDLIPESGFLAIRKDGELVLGVTAAGIESVPLSKGMLEKAVENCCLVVAECNLSVEQLALVVETANRYERPILVGGVSECKAPRILELDEQHRVDVFSLNEEEFLTIEENSVDDLSREDVSRVCSLVRSRHVVVTRGCNGYTVLTDTGHKEDFNAPEVEHCVSSSGAGDALLAGVAAHWLVQRNFNWRKAHRVIKRYFTRVLREEGASVGAVTQDIDYADLKTAKQEERRARYHRIMEEHLVPWFVIFGGMGGIAGVIYLIWVLSH